jgi:hypothetical protein
MAKGSKTILREDHPKRRPSLHRSRGVEVELAILFFVFIW